MIQILIKFVSSSRIFSKSADQKLILIEMHFDVIVHAYSILRFDLHDLISHLYVFVVEYDVIIVKLRYDDVIITMQDRK